MRAQGYGRIIQMSSVLGLVALKYRGAYNATKFALEGLSDTLRMELAGTGIEVILIEPGPILSRFRENAYAAYKRHLVRALESKPAQAALLCHLADLPICVFEAGIAGSALGSDLIEDLNLFT
jgi:NAD(P)-dependent dehydrogenase (short-subunit alcohol dehydrogenase family)